MSIISVGPADQLVSESAELSPKNFFPRAERAREAKDAIAAFVANLEGLAPEDSFPIKSFRSAWTSAQGLQRPSEIAEKLLPLLHGLLDQQEQSINAGGVVNMKLVRDAADAAETMGLSLDEHTTRVLAVGEIGLAPSELGLHVVAQETRSPAVLEILAEHEDFKVRLAVADNVHTAASTLLGLLDDPAVAPQMLSRHGLPKEVVDVAAERVLAFFVPESLNALLADAQAAGTFKPLEAEIVNHWYLACGLAKQPKTGAPRLTHLRQQIVAFSQQVRTSGLPKEMRRQAEHYAYMFDCGLLENKNLPIGMLRELAGSPEWNKAALAAAHPKVTLEMLRTIVRNHKSSNIRNPLSAVARSSKADEPLLAEL
ncbi:hypothetical protein ACFL6C_12745, partial [Myxococcota bacterium]